MKVKKIVTIILAIISATLSVVAFIAGLILCIFNMEQQVNHGLDKPFIFLFGLGVLLLMISVFLITLFYYSFCSYSNCFPNNSSEDFIFEINKNNVGTIENNQLIINMVKEGAFYITSNSEKKLKFDLSGFLFKKSFLRSFFARNYNYLQINKNRLKLKYINRNLYLEYLKKYQDVILKIDGKNYYIVKNNKTKFTVLSRLITFSPFCCIIIGKGNRAEAKDLRNYSTINEKRYQNYRSHGL